MVIWGSITLSSCYFFSLFLPLFSRLFNKKYLFILEWKRACEQGGGAREMGRERERKAVSAVSVDHDRGLNLTTRSSDHDLSLYQDLEAQLNELPSCPCFLNFLRKLDIGIITITTKRAAGLCINFHSLLENYLYQTVLRDLKCNNALRAFIYFCDSILRNQLET